MALNENNTTSPEIEELLGSAEKQREMEEEIRKENEQSSSGFSSAIGFLVAVPVGIYGYINSPDRYSEERLEKEAQKKAAAEVKKSAKSAKRNFTTDERTALREKTLTEFYADYVKWHRKRADKLAKASSNQYFLTAIENANIDAQNRKEAIEKPKREIQSKGVITTPPITDENLRGIPGEQTFLEKPSLTKQSFTRAAPTSTPITPKFADKTTPKIPGNRRGLPHMPKPKLPSIPNPIQNIRTLAMFFNPTNIIIFSLIGIFIAVFFIVFTFGMGGGGAGGASGGSVGGGQQPEPAPGNPPPTNGGNSPLAWAKLINAALEHPYDKYNRMETKFTNNGYTARRKKGIYEDHLKTPAVKSNAYWCTYLTGDAYKLAGYKAPYASGVDALVNAWAGTRGSVTYSLIKNNDLHGIQPGDAVFWGSVLNNPHWGDWAHTDIISEVNINPSNGNGYFKTIDANLDNALGNKITVIHWGLPPVDKRKIQFWAKGLEWAWFGLARTNL